MTTQWPPDDWVKPEPVVLTDGTRLAVRLLPGEGPRVLLVHGLASNTLLWRSVAELVNADGLAVAAVDLRGHGRSDRPAHGHTTAQAAMDLADVVAQLGWSPHDVVLAGQSWGGNVVLRAAATAPWAGVLAVDGGWIHLRGRYATFDQCWAELAPPGFGTRSPDEVMDMIGAMVGDWPSGALAAILGNLEVSGNQVRNRLDSEHHRQILHSLWADDPVARYDAVRSSVHLMVAGRRSSVDVDRAARALADVTVSWHPDAHHDIHLQQPDVVAARLSDVVNRVRGSSL